MSRNLRHRSLPTTHGELGPLRKPRNIVTRSGGIMRGIFTSCRYDKPIKWEAGIEADILPLLEFSSRIRNVTSQPFKLVFEYNGQKTSRTPDFLIETDTEHILVECKPAQKLADPEVHAHLEIGRHQFERRGYRYCIVTDLEIRNGPALANAKFLLPYRMRPLQNTSETARVMALCMRLRESEPSTIGAAVDLLKSKSDVRVLIASGQIHFDFQESLSDSTKIYFTPLTEAQDAAAFLFSK